MVNRNQIEPSDSAPGHWKCVPCKKDFASDSALQAHCRTATKHVDTWCDRCNWLFVTSSAKEDHLKHSSVHWVCYEEDCAKDYNISQELDQHQEQDHAICIPCWTHFEVKGKPSREAWVRHQCEKHFMCESCGKRLENENNRTQHQKTHHPRDKQCFGCPRKFTTYAGMMIHLEAGTCDRPLDISDIDRWTAQCFPEKGSTYPCDACFQRGITAVFRCLSALLQHQESAACLTDSFSAVVQQMLKFIAVRTRIVGHPAGQALTMLAKLYVDNSGQFDEQLPEIINAVPVISAERKDSRIRTVSCLLPAGSTTWTH